MKKCEFTDASVSMMNKCVFNAYVDAVLVRLVIIGLGNCSCELFRILFGELSGDDIFNFNNFFFLNSVV